MLGNLTKWFEKRVIEPSTMAGLAVVLAVFFPGEGEAIREHLVSIVTTLPELAAAVFGLLAIVKPEKGGDDRGKA